MLIVRSPVDQGVVRGIASSDKNSGYNKVDTSVRQTILKSVCTVTCIALLSSLTLPVAAQDDYLQALEQEASTVEELHKAQKEQRELQLLFDALPVTAPAAVKQTPKTVQSPQPDQSPPVTPRPKTRLEVTTVEFEQELFKRFPGSFALYSMLQTGQKTQVQSEYQASQSEGVSRFVSVINKIIKFSISN